MEEMNDLISRQVALDNYCNVCVGVACVDCPFCKDILLGGCKLCDYIDNLPPANTDYFEFTERLYKQAYERGKAEALSTQPEQLTYVPVTNVGDMISRQAVIDTVRAFYDEISYFDSGKNIEDWISEIPSAQPEQRWIPVTERLPESNEEDIPGFMEAYLVQDDMCMDVARWSGEYWISWGYGTVLKNVTAWMPLPEPYKGE